MQERGLGRGRAERCRRGDGERRALQLRPAAAHRQPAAGLHTPAAAAAAAAFHDLTDALRILREIRLMRHFNHENVVAIVDLGPPESLASFEDVYIFSE